MLREGADISLLDIGITIPESPLPAHVDSFLQDAMSRIELFQDTHHVAGFVPSNFATIYHVLHYLKAQCIAPGPHFCEWGSGFGVVASMAAMCGFTACGIEISPDLVAAAKMLAQDYDLDVDFHCNSFIPHGSEHCLEAEEASSWLTEHSGDLEEWGISPENYDVIFVYPWPGEEDMMYKLFDQHASQGSLLLTYQGREEWRLQRKVRRTKQSLARQRKSR